MQPVGADCPVRVNVRVVSATHENLDALCRQARFRADLLFRLNVVSLELPPLRKRVEEIEGLAQLFLEQQAEREGFTGQAVDQ